MSADRPPCSTRDIHQESQGLSKSTGESSVGGAVRPLCNMQLTRRRDTEPPPAQTGSQKDREPASQTDR